jgi:hypothetical protein
MADYIAPMSSMKVSCTATPVKFLDAIETECQSRGFGWWAQLALGKLEAGARDRQPRQREAPPHVRRR